MDDSKKRKKRQYFKNAAKKSKSQYVLAPGLKGFLCTCNMHEKDCVKETYNLLNEYADKLYGEEVQPDSVGESQFSNKKITFKDSDEDSSEVEDEDIQSALAREVNVLKEVRSVAPSERRFQAVNSGAKNVIFIRTTVDDPVMLVETIVEDILLNQQQKSRYLLRLLPIEVTCKAWPDDIQLASEKMLEKHFKCDPKTYCILFNRRNNDNVPRQELIEQIAGCVKRLNPLHQVDVKQPELAVIIEVICGFVCLAVVPKYYQYRKYNLIELSKCKATTSSQPPDEITHPLKGDISMEQSNGKVEEEVKEESKDGVSNNGNCNT